MITTLEPAPAVTVSPPRRRRWWRTLVWSLVIFVCGGVTGHGVAVWMWQEHGRKMFDPKVDRVARILSHMRDVLGLTDDQATQIEVIVRRHDTKMDQIKKEMAPRFAAEWHAMETEVSAVLNDPQREKWQERIKQLKRLHSDRRGPPWGGHEHRGGHERLRDGEHRGDGEQRGGGDSRGRQESTK